MGTSDGMLWYMPEMSPYRPIRLSTPSPANSAIVGGCRPLGGWTMLEEVGQKGQIPGGKLSFLCPHAATICGVLQTLTHWEFPLQSFTLG